MAKKAKGKRKRSNGGNGKPSHRAVTPYVAERIAELAPEYGWDAKEVAELVAGSAELAVKKRT